MYERTRRNKLSRNQNDRTGSVASAAEQRRRKENSTDLQRCYSQAKRH